MEPVHILAKPEDVAERVVVAGDPARVKQLAGMLEDARLVNENRGFLLYTGKYNGVPVSVCCHGIGGPSASIVIEELVMLGAKVIVRLGTCGGMIESLRPGDVVIPTVACYAPGGAVGAYINDAFAPAAPSFEVLKALVEAAEAEGVKPAVGPVFSSDAFYAETPDFARTWSKRGVIAVEMECATIFTLGHLRGVKTGALLVVSDNLVVPEYRKMLTAEQLKPMVDRAARITLNAITKVNP